MALDDTIERIKLVDQSKRIAFAAIVAILIPAWDYFENYEGLEESRTMAQGSRDSARIEYEKAKSDRERLPELEKKLQFTREQLKQAQAKLPESFDIDQILQMTAESATGSGTQISLFEPGPAKQSPNSPDYMEKGIKIEAKGKFLQLAAFIDRIVHLEKLVHVKNMVFKSEFEKDENVGGGGIGEEVVRDLEIQTKDREKIFVKMSMEIITYKITTSADRSSNNINTLGN